MYLDSKKIDKENKRLLELRIQAVKEQKKLHQSSRDKVKGHSKTQTVKDKVSLIVVIWNYPKYWGWLGKTYESTSNSAMNP